MGRLPVELLIFLKFDAEPLTLACFLADFFIS